MIKEYEAKALIDEADAKKLRDELNKQKINDVTQTNIYIDTSDEFYKKNNSALRIRTKNNKNELTLKVRTNDGNEEYNTYITDKQSRLILTGDNSILIELNYPIVHESSDVFNIKIVTKRETFLVNDIEFELDQTLFNKEIDYEIEVESTSISDANKKLEFILKHFKINSRPSSPKIKRYFEYNKKDTNIS